MSIVVVGSVAFDSVETPFGKRERVLGGSGNYFSVAASLFTDVQLVGVVGSDFPQEHIDFLDTRRIDTKGLKKTDGKTFHWAGKYGFDLNEAQTLATELNVFADFDPELPEAFKTADTVFLANIDPVLQRKVLEQVKAPRLTAMDTMNFWIEGKNDELKETLNQVDMLLINESEARQLAREHNTVKAARIIQEMGPRTVVIKRGEYGALFFQDEHVFFAPAYPLESVFDPTGAGDTFAAGFLGWIDKQGKHDLETCRQAMLVGSVMASYVVEDFSFDRIRDINIRDIEDRFSAMRRLTTVDGTFNLD
jgi:sugar/nucleoside kinase (ribokinase family)